MSSPNRNESTETSQSGIAQASIRAFRSAVVVGIQTARSQCQMHAWSPISAERTARTAGVSFLVHVAVVAGLELAPVARPAFGGLTAVSLATWIVGPALASFVLGTKHRSVWPSAIVGGVAGALGIAVVGYWSAAAGWRAVEGPGYEHPLPLVAPGTYWPLMAVCYVPTLSLIQCVPLWWRERAMTPIEQVGASETRARARAAGTAVAIHAFLAAGLHLGLLTLARWETSVSYQGFVALAVGGLAAVPVWSRGPKACFAWPRGMGRYVAYTTGTSVTAAVFGLTIVGPAWQVIHLAEHPPDIQAALDFGVHAAFTVSVVFALGLAFVLPFALMGAFLTRLATRVRG